MIVLGPCLCLLVLHTCLHTPLVPSQHPRPGAAETFLSTAQDGSLDGSLKQRVQHISLELDIDTSLPLWQQMEHAFVAMLGRPPSAAEAPPSAAHESTVLALA